MRPFLPLLFGLALAGCLGNPEAAAPVGPAASPTAAGGSATGQVQHTFVGACETPLEGCWGVWETETGSFRVASPASTLTLTATWTPGNPTADQLRVVIVAPDDRTIESVGGSPLEVIFEGVPAGGYEVDVAGTGPAAAMTSQVVAWSAVWS